MDIKKKIQEHGMTLAQVAEKLSVSPPTLSAICKNKNPKLNTLKRIADAIGITLSELVSDDNEESVANIVCPYCGKKIRIKPDIDE